MSKTILFGKGIRDGIPIGLGYFAVAFALGIAAGEAGFSAAQAATASLLCNASAGEYAAFSLYAAGAGYAEAALMEIVANARYLLMSCTLSQKFAPNSPFFHRLLVGFDLTDEIFAVNVSRDGYLEPAYAYGTMLPTIPGWAIGTFIGALAGNLLPEFAVSSLSVGLFGMFLAIVVPPAIKRRAVAAVVAASFALSSVARFVPVLAKISPGIVTIVLTVAISLAAAIIKPVPEVWDED